MLTWTVVQQSVNGKWDLTQRINSGYVHIHKVIYYLINYLQIICLDSKVYKKGTIEKPIFHL